MLAKSLSILCSYNVDMIIKMILVVAWKWKPRWKGGRNQSFLCEIEINFGFEIMFGK